MSDPCFQNQKSVILYMVLPGKVVLYYFLVDFFSSNPVIQIAKLSNSYKNDFEIKRHHGKKKFNGIESCTIGAYLLGFISKNRRKREFMHHSINSSFLFYETRSCLTNMINM